MCSEEATIVISNLSLGLLLLLAAVLVIGCNTKHTVNSIPSLRVRAIWGALVTLIIAAILLFIFNLWLALWCLL